MWKTLTNLIWPLYCESCGAYDVHLCPDCKQELRGDIKPQQISKADGEVQVYAGVPYTGVSRALILGFKDHGREDYRKYIAYITQEIIRLMYENGEFKQQITVVPAPSSKQSFKQRGFLQTEVIAQFAVAALKQLGIRAKVQNILEQKAKRKQVNFGGADRQKNKTHAVRLRRKYRPRSLTFPCHPELVSGSSANYAESPNISASCEASLDQIDDISVASKRARSCMYDTASGQEAQKERNLDKSSLLVVDDICTTGSTLLECTKALLPISSGHVSALALACVL
jgi:predicted amidophosphoribosyltransferase